MYLDKIAIQKLRENTVATHVMLLDKAVEEAPGLLQKEGEEYIIEDPPVCFTSLVDHMKEAVLDSICDNGGWDSVYWTEDGSDTIIRFIP